MSDEVHIFRIHNKERNFTIVDNRLIDDERLSFRSTGVLVWLLSRPPTWIVRSNAMAKSKTEGRDAVRTALSELEDAGYVVRRRVQSDGGHWQWETHVYEDPKDADFQASVSQASVSQASEIQASVSQASLEEEAVSTESVSTEEVSTDKKPPAGEYSEIFEEAWSSYPRKVAKKNAYKAWKARLKLGASPDDLLLAARNYARQCSLDRTEERSILHPATFWGPTDRWEDFMEFHRNIRDPRDNVATDREAPGGLIDPRAFRRTDGVG